MNHSSVQDQSSKCSVNESETFEIHITGNHRIHEVGKALGLKTIQVELLDLNYNVIRVEHMTSIVVQKPNYAECLQFVLETAEEIRSHGCRIIRTKIECPVYEHYIKKALYIESHFKYNSNIYPISRNVTKDYNLGTCREWDRTKFETFFDTWKDSIIELCLFDTYPEEDLDWLGLWSMK